jgi:hypothetical protein
VEQGTVRVRVNAAVAKSFTFVYQVCDTTNLCAQAKVRVTMALSILNIG